MKIQELTLDKLGTWPLAAKLSLVTLICLIIFIFFFTFDAKPLYSKTQQLAKQEENLRSALQVKHSLADNYPTYQKKTTILQQKMSALGSELPLQINMPELISALTKMAKQADLKLTLIKPQEEQHQDFYTELPIKMLLTGSYSKLHQFLLAIAQFPQILVIEQGEITSTNTASPLEDKALNTSLIMEITLSAYKGSLQLKKTATSVVDLPAAINAEKYPLIGIRDPFMPYLSPKNPYNSTATLQTYALTELHFVGLLANQQERWALISAPNGQIYHLSVGQYLSSQQAKVIAIKENSLIVEETLLTPSNNPSLRQTELRLNTALIEEQKK